MISCTFKAINSSGDVFYVTASPDVHGGFFASSASFPNTCTFAGSIASAVTCFCREHSLNNPVPVETELLDVISHLMSEVADLKAELLELRSDVKDLERGPWPDGY